MAVSSPPTRRVGRLAVLLLLAPIAVLGAGSASAHEGIESSEPASGSTIAEPISSVTIDFGVVIGDNTELGLVGPDGAELASTTTVTSDTTAEVTFAPITTRGTYVVNYLAPSVVDGHLIAGSINFTYGDVTDGSPGPAILPWILFAVAAVAILGIGAWFSLQRHRHAATDPLDEASTPG